MYNMGPCLPRAIPHRWFPLYFILCRSWSCSCASGRAPQPPPPPKYSLSASAGAVGGPPPHTCAVVLLGSGNLGEARVAGEETRTFIFSIHVPRPTRPTD